MGLVLRAVLSFTIAFAVTEPVRFWGFLDTHALHQMQADIAAQQPEKKLWSPFTERDSRFGHENSR
jgi:hypothetical protein